MIIKNTILVVLISTVFYACNFRIKQNVEKDKNGKIISKEIINKCDGSLTKIAYNSEGNKMRESTIKNSVTLSTKIYNEDELLVAENKTFEHLTSGVTVANRRNGTIGYISIGRTSNTDKYMIFYDTLGVPIKIVLPNNKTISLKNIE